MGGETDEHMCLKNEGRENLLWFCLCIKGPTEQQISLLNFKLNSVRKQPPCGFWNSRNFMATVLMGEKKQKKDEKTQKLEDNSEVLKEI